MAKMVFQSDIARTILDGQGNKHFVKKQQAHNDEKAITPVNLDFVLREDVSREEIEEGIANILQGQNLANLAIAIAVDKITKDGLWAMDTKIHEDGTIEKVQSKYHSPSEYWNEFSPRFGLLPEQVSQYRNAGENYRMYRKLLDSVGFKEKGNFTKLVKLDKVMKKVEEGIVGEDEVKDVISSGTMIQFSNLIFRTRPTEIRAPEFQKITTPTVVSMQDNIMKVDDEPLLSFSASVDPSIRTDVAREVKEIIRRKDAGLIPITVEATKDEEPIFIKILSMVREILDAGDYPGVIRAYDVNEARVAVDYAESFLKKRRANDNVTPASMRGGKA